MSTRWKFEISALSPSGEGIWQVGIPVWLFEELHRHGPKPKFFRMGLTKAVCESPLCIREGWEREGKEESLIYIGSPEFDYHSNTVQLPPPPGMLFFVFVLPDGTIDDWRWQKCAESEAFENCEGLGKLKWPTITT